MARTQQDILVKIKVLLEGLGNVRALAGHVKDLNAGGGQTAALAGNIDRLAVAVDHLATASAKTSKSSGSFVRFLVGVSAVVNTLSALPAAFEGLNKLLDFLDNIGGGIAAAFGKVTGVVSSLFSKVSEVVTGVGARAGAAVSGLGGAVGGLGAAFAAALPVVLAVGAALSVALAAVASLAVAFTGLAASVGLGLVALLKIGPAGIELNSQLEQAKLGVAAVISSLAQVKVDGKPVEGAEKLAAAFSLADEQVQKLRVDAINTTATFEQILPAFQEALAPGLAAGLSLDEIRNVTVQVVQAAGALNIPLHQVNQEVRAILEGNIDINARLAKSLDISAEDIKRWKQKGTLAEELNKKLGGFSVAGIKAAQTMEGLKSNLQEALNVFNQEATTRAFAALKDEFARLLPQLFDFKNSTIQAQFKALAQLADDVLVRVIRIGGSIAQGVVSGLKRAADFVTQNKTRIGEILSLVEMVVRQLLQAAGVIARVASDTGTWKSLLDSVKGVLVLINLALAVMVGELRRAEPLLRLMALAGAALLATTPALAALSGTPAGGVKGNQQDLDNEMERLRSKQAGSVTIGTLPKVGGGGGGKGGGGRQSQVRELTRALDEARIDTALARSLAKVDLIKQSIEASVQAVQDGLEDSITSISEAFRLEAALADKYLKNELDRLAAESRAARERRDLAVTNLDPKLTDAERRLAIAAEDKKFAKEIVELDRERDRLTQETLDKKNALVRAEAQAREELARSIADIENQFDSLSLSNTQRAEARAREIDAQFAETRAKLLAEINAVSTEANREAQRAAQEALDQLDSFIERLKAKGLFEETAKDIERIFSKLRDEQARLNDKVASGDISAADALKERVELGRQAKRHAEEYLNALNRAAEATKDPATREALKQIVFEVENLGRHIDEVAQRLNESIKAGLIDTLTDIITRTKTVGEAFRALAQTILAEIARILATKFIENLFGVFGSSFLTTKSGGGNSLGGFLNGLLSGGFAQGGVQPATPGGRIIRVAEGGFDEVVLTTDPKHRGRTSRLLGQFLRRTGLAPDFGAAVLEGAVGGISSFAAGGFALSGIEPPEGIGGDVFNVNVNAPITTPNPQAFRQSEQAIKRDLARAAQDGIRRAKSRPR